MRLVVLGAIAAGMIGALVVLILGGGRGDQGNALRYVALPTPRSHLVRVFVYMILVTLAGCALTIDDHTLAGISRAWIAEMLRAVGFGAAQVGAYAPEVNPLPAALLTVSLLLFYLIRPLSLRSVVAGFMVTALTSATLAVVAAAVDAFAAKAGLPAVATIYAVDLASLFTGLLGFMAGLFRASMLPQRYRYKAVVPGLLPGLAISLVALVALVAGIAGFRLAAAVAQPEFSGVALLVFLVVPIAFFFFQLSLFLFRRKERPGRPVNPAPRIDVIMAAWNEEEQIQQTLWRIQLAAAAYPGAIRVILADDGSTDRTVELALAMNRPGEAEIVVLRCQHAGKGPALNSALAFATSDIIARIDADILVEPPVFNNLPGWFANPNIGCVGAFDMPNFQLPAWYTKGRLFECLYTFGFCRLAYERFDANNIPGTFLAFRRAEAVALGGFVEGMNGEDSDLTFNFGRLGLVSVIDPTIVIYEDVPQGLTDFLKQRTRWARASIHVAARHLPRSLSEYTPRYAIQLRFVYVKVGTLLRTVTYIEGAAFILSDGRPGTMMLRGLLLLSVGFVPQYVLLMILCVVYRLWREIPWLVIWFPFTVLRKVAMLNGIMSVPPYRSAPDGKQTPVEPATRRAVMAR
jgi:cellulose synthase/poly-beta-1,6-N-acetylglucosamine synthase-like glycosyltransferase